MGLVRSAQRQPEEAPVAELVRRLDDPDAEVRQEAALELAGVGESVPELLSRVGSEPDPRVRATMLTTLAGYDTEVVAAGLAIHLASDEAGLRSAVAEALGAMPRSVPALLPGLLAAPDHHVRVMTVLVLAALATPDAQAWLVRMIVGDPHPNVVSAAIDALLPTATATHVPIIQAAARRFPDDPFLSFTVRMALPVLADSVWRP